MKSYTYSEARENFASVLEEAAQYGAVEIRRRDGSVFRVIPGPSSQKSPLDVQGVKVDLSTEALVAVVREMRERG